MSVIKWKNYYSRWFIFKILKEFLVEPDDFNVCKIDYAESSIEEIISESSSLPLGYEKKAVVVDNAVFLTKDAKDIEKTEILDLVNTKTNDIAVIFILRSYYKFSLIFA